MSVLMGYKFEPKNDTNNHERKRKNNKPIIWWLLAERINEKLIYDICIQTCFVTKTKRHYFQVKHWNLVRWDETGDDLCLLNKKLQKEKIKIWTIMVFWTFLGNEVILTF